MKFSYKAKNKDGAIVEGAVDAPDRIAAARQLREHGEIAFALVPEREKRHFSIPIVGALLNRVGLHEKIQFCRNLSGMLSAGLSLYRALGVLEKQTANKKFKSILGELMKGIDKGETLSQGLEKYPAVFNTLFIAMVRAGEESGGMVAALKEVGLNLDKSYALNKKIKGALTYPSIIVGAIVIIGILMFMFVVPTLTKTFKELNVSLPATTKFIIWVSETISGHPFLVFGFLIFMTLGLWRISKIKMLKKYVDAIILRLPVIGPIAREVNSARTARTVSSLLVSGVAMTRSLEINKDVLQNVYYKRILEKSIAAVQKGVPLSKVFSEDTRLYPIMFSEMVEVGEETGKLSQMLLDIAEFYEGEVESKTKNLSTIIEPVLMVFIGAAVGFFAVSMISPMYSLLDNL